MDAHLFLERIASAGFAVTINDVGGLRVSPASRLSDSQRQFLRAHKPALLAALAGKASAQLAEPGSANPSGATPEPAESALAEVAPLTPEALRAPIHAGWRVTVGSDGRAAWRAPGTWTPTPEALAEPAAPIPPSRAPTPAELAAVTAWLDAIGEDNPAARDEVLVKCRAEAAALEFFLGRAEAPQPVGAYFDSITEQTTCLTY